MKKEEHTKKDFQVFTQELLLYNSAILRTVLQNQMFIFNLLSKTDKSYSEEINKQLKINQEFMEKMGKSFPTHQDMEVPLKDYQLFLDNF